MLDGAARIDGLLKGAAEMGMPAITTDHGYVFGAYEFWSKARRYGVTPIIGVEAYLTPGTHRRRDKTRVRWGDDTAERDDVGGGGACTHMTLLARTTGGMHNLFRMRLAGLDGGPLLQAAYRPRACASTRRPPRHHRVRRRDPNPAAPRPVRRGTAVGRRAPGPVRRGELLRRGHGPRHPHRAADPARAARLAKDLDIPSVATNDLHYTKAEDAKAHAALLCVQSARP